MTSAQKLIKTEYYIIQTTDKELPQTKHSIDWPEEPTYDQLKELIEPIVGDWIECVRVLFQDTYLDMFVHEGGRVIIPPLPRNNVATDIYRANWLKQYPATHPESLEWIAGPAVLFLRKVWF